MLFSGTVFKSGSFDRFFYLAIFRAQAWLSLFFWYFDELSEKLAFFLPIRHRSIVGKYAKHTSNIFTPLTLSHKNGRFYDSLLSSITRLWNDLRSLFPHSYNIGLFETQIRFFLSWKRSPTQYYQRWRRLCPIKLFFEGPVLCEVYVKNWLSPSLVTGSEEHGTYHPSSSLI